ncbi:MAG: GNAT family N-acetyltransferase [Litorilinea sp.]
MSVPEKDANHSKDANNGKDANHSEVATTVLQLEMLWPTHDLVRTAPNPADESELPLHLAAGYRLRFYTAGQDDADYVALMVAAGFEDWTADRLILCQMTALPYGWYVAVDERTDAIVATCMATHRPTPAHPYGGELGWVAAHPDHRGHKLGWTVCAAVTNRLRRAGYDNIYLKTDDFRAPAILTYLRMGYLPYLYAPDMAARWETICTQLQWPYTPAQWPAGGPEPVLGG